MGTLTRSDRDKFARFEIDAELVNRAGIRRVTDREARDYGISGPSGTLEGVLYPYCGPDGEPRRYSLRRDAAPGNLSKYVASKDRTCWAFPPEARGRCADPNTLVVFVESVTSMLMLEGIRGRSGQPLLPIALGGAYGWQGRIGTQTDARGARCDERGPVRDFQIITWNDREVVILFDSNTDDPADGEKQRKLQANRDRLAEHLQGLGARVRIGVVPVEAEVNGPDDYFARHDQVAVLRLLGGASPWTPAASPRAKANQSAKASQTTRLEELLNQAGATYFSSPDGQRFFSVRVNGHTETYAVPSRQTRDYLTSVYYRDQGTAPSSQALHDALALIDARAGCDGTVEPVSVRVAGAGAALYLDLGDPTWRVVEITADGWRLVENAPVRFRRPKGQRPLPCPEMGGTIELLRPLVNVRTREDFLLLVSFLVGCLRPVGPYPVLALSGEQGSAKSTTARILKDLIDPGVAGLRAEPKEVRDLMIGALNGHVVAYDNISQLSPWLSDALCRMSTGGGFATRTLYSDTDETLIEAQRPVILTGIDDYVTRGDLLDRSIVVNLPRLTDEKRFTEEELRVDFAKHRPVILGALLDGVAGALRDKSSVRPGRLPRMADFAVWAAAAAGSLGWTCEAFIDAYNTGHLCAIERNLDTEILMQALLKIDLPWAGTAGMLLELLSGVAAESLRRARGWPRNPRSMSEQLRRLAPHLREIGLDVGFSRTATERRIGISRLDNPGDTASLPSTPSPCTRDATNYGGI